MPKKGPVANKSSRGKKNRPIPKHRQWWLYYTDETNPVTFGNALQSAKAVYDCKNDNSAGQIGFRNLQRYRDKVNKWFDEEGLSDEKLKFKLLSLINADETKIIKIKGEVNPEDLPSNCVILGKSSVSKTTYSKDGEETVSDEGETIIGINVQSLAIQQKALDMAFKAKGLYAPERFELTGEDGGPIQTETKMVNLPPEPKDLAEWEAWVKAKKSKEKIKESGT